jgi:hypothetical protein
MRLNPTYLAEDQGVRTVHDIITSELGWFCTVNPLPDYGIDAQAEVVTDGVVTGRWLAIQIKGGNSWFRSAAGDGWNFYEDGDHLAYWLGHSLPVIVVIVDDDGHAYWEQVTTSTVRDTPSGGFALTIPRTQPLGLASRDKLLEVTERGNQSTASLADLYEILPPAAAGPLQRAADADWLAATRLAERLANGNVAPDATGALVLAAQPSWVNGSPAAQDLWLAVASYAAEHNLRRESGEAFARAADSAGSRCARARALAGVQLISSDREVARDLLERAREEGETVVVDVGLTALSLPEGDAGPYDIPESLRTLPQSQVDSDPFLLNFLGEAALRRREYTEAVSLRERAVAAAGDRDSTYRLALAASLRRRALSEPGNSGADLRRALGYAQAAVAERRRWRGPSAQALEEVLDILTMASDVSAVITAALPESLAGTALEAEAAAPGVARRGGHAALASGDRQAYEMFVQRLPSDGAYRRELQAQDDEDQGRSRAEMITVWAQLATDPADDAMAARCATALARLGVWAPQADELHARSILPDAEYETLRAVCRAEAGEPDLGIARLRELADASVLAAGELVLLLERLVGSGEAIREAERQAARWQSPVLQIQYVQLLGRHGRFPDAVAFIERAIPDQSLPAEVRVRLCSWYVTHQAQQGSLAAAAATAQLGLAVAEDVDLAWKLVTVLQADGSLIEARQALDRYRLEPITEQEMRLWMQLHLGVPVLPDAARVMIGLADGLPDGEFRDAIIAMLIREASLAGSTGRFPPDIVAAIAGLADATANRPGTGLRIDPDDATALQTALEKKVPDRTAYEQILTRVQGGTAPMADIASFAGQPYGAVLLHRPAGLLPAADLKPLIRAVGEEAARQAVKAGSCVADLSSMYLLALLTDDDRLRIRSVLPRTAVIVARSAVDDALLTRDHARNLSAATYTASLAPDGSVERTTLTPAERVLLLTQAEALETAAASAQSRRPSPTADVAADTIAVARESQLPLWCDDIALRQKARLAGATAFSLLDLITVLQADGAAFNLPETCRRLARQYIVDLPLGAADITAIAAFVNWQPGPAHTALARPAWWAHHDPGWEEAWLEIAIEARRQSADALTAITRAAITGALQHVAPSFATQRYQQIAVLALLACHDSAQPAPDGFLRDLARQAREGLAPASGYVLTALIRELEDRGSTDPVSTAMGLLPGVGLP